MRHERQKQAEILALDALRVITNLVAIYAEDDAELEAMQKNPEDGILYPFGRNNGNSLTAPKKEDQMLIEVPGVSVNQTPRRDGRYQGYVTVNGDKKYVYGRSYEETVQKVNIYWREKQKEAKKHAKLLEKEIIRQQAQKAIEDKERSLQATKRAAVSPEGIPLTVQGFMEYYFERFRSRRVAKITLENDRGRCKKHIFPALGEKFVSDLSDTLLQDYIDELSGISLKTAKECRSLLSGMFDYAVLKKIIDVNLCKLVIVEPYESEHGVALTPEEERRLIESLRSEPKYLIALSVALYCGLRPCEYRTARIEGAFIVSQNCKRHSRKYEEKRIPIQKKLQEILCDVHELYFPNKKYMRDRLIAVCPDHKLYDLRTTFNTRCKAAHVDDFARKTFMGHGIDRLEKAYTDLPDEWFISEMKKLDNFPDLTLN